MAGGGWSCPHELDGACGKVAARPCEPGMKGCELYGRYVFFDGRKNERLLEKQNRSLLRPEISETPSLITPPNEEKP